MAASTSITTRPIWLLLLLPLLWAGNPAEEMALPVQVQYGIFKKVLQFDRALEARAGEELVIGVLYQPKVRESLVAKEELLELVRQTGEGVKGLPLRGVAVEAGSAASLQEAIDQEAIDVLYVSPLRAVEVGMYAAVTRASQVMTLTGVPRFVGDGLSVGIGVNGNRPEILVNLTAARAEGVALSAQLLKLARIIED